VKSNISESWINLSDEDLLQKRICDLRLQIEGSDFYPSMASLYENLEAKNILLKPACYLADEWFVLEGETAIGIPFFLAHPRLKKLEEKMMLEVEGGNPEWFMKLLRHEAGHSIYYGYNLHKRSEVNRLFGPPSSEETPHYYRPKPYSKSFVRHLDNWYAQAEPDEDFAETFAVWLTPDFDWKSYYKGWPALKKLQCMDQLMQEIAGKKPSRISNIKGFSAQSLRLKLATYYQRKQKLYAQDYPDFYDQDLKKIFSFEEGIGTQAAAKFMKKNRRMMIDKVCQWTGEKKLIVHNLYKKLNERCEKLKMKYNKDEELILIELSAYLTSVVSNYLYTGKFKPTV